MKLGNEFLKLRWILNPSRVSMCKEATGWGVSEKGQRLDFRFYVVATCLKMNSIVGFLLNDFLLCLHYPLLLKLV